jgi:hypothetical protein
MMAKKVAPKQAAKGAKKAARKGKRAAAGSKHAKRRIGHVGRNHPSLPYKADWATVNEVYVFGDRIGQNPNRITPKLESTRYIWDYANARVFSNTPNGLIIKCKCKPKTRHKPKGPGFTTDDDITVTLEFDDPGLPPDETEEEFDEVPFEP